MDPASAIGIAGAAVQICQIVGATIKGLSGLRGKFNDADLTIRLLITELSTIKSSITQLNELAEYNSEGIPKHPDYLDGLDIALDGCRAIMDVLSEEVTRLGQGVSVDGEASQGLGFRARMRVIWNEDLMRDHRQRLQSQVLALQLLLQACQCRTMTEQVNLLRQEQNRRLIRKVADDTLTLRSTMSGPNSQVDNSTASAGASSAGDTVFDFDHLVRNAAAYRRVMSPIQPELHIQPPETAAVGRHHSNATTASRTDEGYASGSAISPARDRSLSAYLSSRPFEALQQSNNDNMPRSHTVSFGSSRASPQNQRDNVRRWQSAPGIPPSKTTKDKVRSALRRLNTASRRSLAIPSFSSPASPQASPHAHRRNRLSEPNISVDYTSLDGIAAPAIVKAAQAGAKTQVETLIADGAGVESLHISTGRSALAVAAHCGKDEVVDLLIQHNANVNRRDVNMATPLHLAAARGHTGALNLLLAEDVEIDAKDSQGRTAFWIAANAGHLEATKLLLEMNCKVSSRGDDQMTALHVAAKHGDEEMVSLLLYCRADTEAKDIHMMTALHYACERGHVGTISVLLDNNANIEAAGANRMTPLICAAAAGQLQAGQHLLKKRALLRGRDEHGMNALHWAAFNGHVEMVDLLLQKGISGRSVNEKGRTPLHLAAMNKQFAVVELLLRRDVPLELRCNQGFTALHYACHAKSIEIVRLLLAGNADIEAQILEHRRRPIHVAASLGSVELLKLLSDQGANVNSVDSAGNRAICIASRHGHVDAVAQLLDAGAVLRKKRSGGISFDSALCLAAKEGHLEVVTLLLDRGASAEERDDAGWNPLIYAAHYGHPPVLDALLRRTNLSLDNPLFSYFDLLGFSPTGRISDENKASVRSLLLQKKEGLSRLSHTSAATRRTYSPDIQNLAPIDALYLSSQLQAYRNHTVSQAPVNAPPNEPVSAVHQLPSTVEEGLSLPRLPEETRHQQTQSALPIQGTILHSQPSYTGNAVISPQPRSAAVEPVSAAGRSHTPTPPPGKREQSHSNVNRETRSRLLFSLANPTPLVYKTETSNHDMAGRDDNIQSDTDSIASFHTAIASLQEEGDVSEVAELA